MVAGKGSHHELRLAHDDREGLVQFVVDGAGQLERRLQFFGLDEFILGLLQRFVGVGEFVGPLAEDFLKIRDSQMDLDAGQQLFVIERLLEEVVRPQVQRPHPPADVMEGGDDDDGQAARRFVLPDFLDHLIPVHPGQDQIEEKKVGRLGRDALQGFFSAR